MPLHLLGKKSWNVYNQDNIDRVRHDEAAEEAREAAEEQSMQEADARRRMKLLRGETPDPEERPSQEQASTAKRSNDDSRLGLDTTYGDRDRKRKRQRGEDDTDRDMRYAKRQVEDRPENDERRIVRAGKIDDDAKLVDHAGHINLFPTNAVSKEDMRSARVDEKERRKLQREREQQEPPVMRLSEAAGRSRGGDSRPWYSSSRTTTTDDDQSESVRRDVWGNEDPNRKSRDQARTASNDPLAAMMAGVKQVRKVEADRKKWREDREEELRSMRKYEERRRRKERHRRDSVDDLESFSLDTVERSGDRNPHTRHRDRNHREHRQNRSSERERRRHHDD